MKKTLLIMMVLLLISSGSIFALGVGAAWVFDVNNPTCNCSAMIQISHEKIPGTILSVSMAISDNNATIGIVDDWWLYKQHLTGVLHLAIGPGFIATIHSNSDTDELFFNLGGRIAIDARAFIMDPLEIFFEYAPSVSVVNLGNSENSINFPDFDWLQFALGIRFWF